jgi:hypothetical protein
MALRGRRNNAALMDVAPIARREEFASLMAQQGNDAATRGVPTEVLREEFVSLMVQL